MILIIIIIILFILTGRKETLGFGMNVMHSIGSKLRIFFMCRLYYEQKSFRMLSYITIRTS